MMESIRIVSEGKSLVGEINLPLSKSISNRVLMICAIMGWTFDELIISEADDSRLLKHLLTSIAFNETSLEDDLQMDLDCKNAGTVFRFLTPFLTTRQKDYLLSGSQRMRERPIAPLVNALVEMGANIAYVEEEGYPPLSIRSGDLDFERVHIDISQSSQFASALLLILPVLKEQSMIILEGELSSMPYIEMTLKLMSRYGVQYDIEDREITLEGSYQYPGCDLEIEADWSSASYWYQMLALAGHGELLLKDLRIDSLQGDAALVEIFKSLGVQSQQHDKGVYIKADGEVDLVKSIDFKSIPDLAPTVIATCAALGVMGRFTGLEGLNLKESRRMDVLCAELEKLGYDLRDTGMEEYVLINNCKPEFRALDFSEVLIDTADDHRMAMAFAPFALVGKNIQISYPNSVNKSYPMFWEEIRRFVRVG